MHPRIGLARGGFLCVPKAATRKVTMSLEIDVEKISEVLLADGWHKYLLWETEDLRSDWMSTNSTSPSSRRNPRLRRLLLGKQKKVGSRNLGPGHAGLNQMVRECSVR
jgi:hypothetical protein